MMPTIDRRGELGNAPGVHALVVGVSKYCHLPGVEEAKKRIAYLEAHGATQFAFTFKAVFPADEKFQQSIDWSSFHPCPAT